MLNDSILYMQVDCNGRLRKAGRGDDLRCEQKSLGFAALPHYLRGCHCPKVLEAEEQAYFCNDRRFYNFDIDDCYSYL